MNRPYAKLLRNRLTIRATPFYRRFPYQGQVSVVSADARGCVDPKLRYFCNRIPKAANSTVVTTLALLSFGRNLPSKTAKRRFMTPSMLSRQEVAELEDYFCFTVVRNPYTRVLSAFLDKVERRALIAGKTVEFREFLRELSDGKLHSNAHWAPQSALLLLPLGRLDFIGRVENLEQDLDQIRRRICPAGPGPAPVHSVLSNSTGATGKLGEYYDAEAIEIVRELYTTDFEYFGYPKDFPISPVPAEPERNACNFPS